MDTTPPNPEARPAPGRLALSPTAAIGLAIACGLGAGYLDLLVIVFKKYCWNDQTYYWNARDFPWSVPVGHALLLVIPGAVVAVVNRRRPGLISLRAGAWLFAAPAVWMGLLRMPLYGACSLILAVGLGRPISGAVAAHWRPRRARSTLAGLVGLLVLLVALSSGRAVLREWECRARTELPAPPPGARNVLLLVWDTVRSYNLSTYGYLRDTTPNLTRWARKGVRYRMALAAAPWTYPSHCCFFTGRWPYQLNPPWTYTLEAGDLTLAEYLASRGYQTAGFVANTTCCSYETGLDRGFAHYEDYPWTWRSLLSRTVPGSWILENLVSRGDFYDHKWIRLQSRDARGINAAFLDWLHRRRRRDRPFFAFLNYFDAHAPYVPPAGYEGRFGARPQGPRDYRFLLDYLTNQMSAGIRDILLARDCYDDCIAFLDDQLGRLLEALQGQGLLDNTVVILTSDHGEGFGDHGVLGHPTSVYLDEIAVPLMILAPGAPAGRVVDSPVSLRDLPATVVDLLGAAGSPFPGRSLAACWRVAPGQPDPEISPALSERTDPIELRARPRDDLGRRGLQMSLVAAGHHYIRDGMGPEELYDLKRDPFEQVNLLDSPAGKQAVGVFRKRLLDALTEDPASIEVENAYMKPFRQWLGSLVQERAPPRDPGLVPGPRIRDRTQEPEADRTVRTSRREEPRGCG